jgi:hypothetical protein
MHFSQPIPVNGHRYQNFYQAICFNRRLITRRQEFSIAMFKLTHRILTNLKGERHESLGTNATRSSETTFW